MATLFQVIAVPTRDAFLYSKCAKAAGFKSCRLANLQTCLHASIAQQETCRKLEGPQDTVRFSANVLFRISHAQYILTV